MDYTAVRRTTNTMILLQDAQLELNELRLQIESLLEQLEAKDREIAALRGETA